MAEAQFQSLLQRNAGSLSEYRNPFMLRQAVHQEPRLENQRIFIITCADPRVDPAFIFNLKPAEIAVMRNAGGLVSDDTFRSLEVMGSLANIGLIVVMRHTDCGGLYTTEEEVRTRTAARNPACAHELQGKVFGTYQHVGLEESVRQDVAKVKAWSFLPETAKVVGYAFEVETGKVREVECS